jgi:hypothetical protein
MWARGRSMSFTRDAFASLEPSGDAKTIAALKNIIKIYEHQCEHFAKRRA